MNSGTAHLQFSKLLRENILRDIFLRALKMCKFQRVNGLEKTAIPP